MLNLIKKKGTLTFMIFFIYIDLMNDEIYENYELVMNIVII